MNEPPALSVGVPTEVKEDERRVALTPDGVREMEAHGVEVLVQAGAGEGASIPDEAYKAAGRRDRRRPPPRCGRAPGWS